MNRNLWVAFGDQPPRRSGAMHHFHGPLVPMDQPKGSEAIWLVRSLMAALVVVLVLSWM